MDKITRIPSLPSGETAFHGTITAEIARDLLLHLSDISESEAILAQLKFNSRISTPDETWLDLLMCYIGLPSNVMLEAELQSERMRFQKVPLGYIKTIFDQSSRNLPIAIPYRRSFDESGDGFVALYHSSIQEFLIEVDLTVEDLKGKLGIFAHYDDDMESMSFEDFRTRLLDNPKQNVNLFKTVVLKPLVLSKDMAEERYACYFVYKSFLEIAAGNVTPSQVFPKLGPHRIEQLEDIFSSFDELSTSDDLTSLSEEDLRTIYDVGVISGHLPLNVEYETFIENIRDSIRILSEIR